MRICLPRQILVWCDVDESYISSTCWSSLVCLRLALVTDAAFLSCVRCRVSSGFGMPCFSSAWLVWFDFVLSCMDVLSALFVFGSGRVLFRFFFLFACLFFCVSPCFVALSRLGLSHAWGGVFFCVCRLTWRVLPVVSSGLPCRFCCGHWFLLPAVSLCDSALRVTPAETRLTVYRRRQVCFFL